MNDEKGVEMRIFIYQVDLCVWVPIGRSREKERGSRREKERGARGGGGEGVKVRKGRRY